MKMTSPSDIQQSTQDLADALNADKPRKKWPWIAGAAAFVLLALGGGSTAYAMHYSDRALPGTTVAGMDVSGSNAQQIAQMIQDKATQTTLELSGDVTATASLDDLGVSVDSDATAHNALAANSSIVKRFTALFTDTPVDVVSTLDEQTLATYTTSLIPEGTQRSTNAMVVLADGAEQFTITPAVTGQSLNDADIAQAATQAASTLSSGTLAVSLIDAPPAISDDDAQAVADTANEWVSTPIELTKPDSDLTFSPDDATKASWITVTPPTADAHDASIELSVNTDAVHAWVSEQAEEAKTEPINGSRRLLQDGTVVATPVEAVDGAEVASDDVSTQTQGIAAAMESHTAYDAPFAMTVLKAQWEEKIIADGAQNLAYPAAPGEKWIDINLGNKTITAYEGATVVRGPEPMVDGSASHPTVTGQYAVTLKYESQTMRGDDYETPGVPWISYFYLGYAIHGAPWRSSFGYSGSHGCINLPVESAKWYYFWDEIGTPVNVHY